MAKILTDVEMVEIIHGAVHDCLIDDKIQYTRFLEGLGDLIAEHFGGERGNIGEADADLGWTCAFRINECVPEDGGIFAEYDKDVTWKDGKEVSK